MNYRQGLENLSAMIKVDTDAWLQFERYRGQLLENLANEREYGSTEQLRNDRFHIVDRLNELCRDLLSYVSFTDLCSMSAGDPDWRVHIQTVKSTPSLLDQDAPHILGEPDQTKVPSGSRTQSVGDVTRAPIFLQTIKDRLNVVSNNYSMDESLFQSGEDVPLVDTRDTHGLPELDATRIRRTKAAHIQPILQGGIEVPPISIIIPIFGGARVLAECLLSLARQTLVERRGSLVEGVIIEDGIPEGEQSVFVDPDVFRAIELLRDHSVLVKCLRLRTNHGRAQARNVGLANIQHPVVLFVDGSMILDSEFLTEHVWRHARVPNAALLGFKENIDLPEFERQRTQIVSGLRRPDFRKDLKWSHRLAGDEAGHQGFYYQDQHFDAGDVVNYMMLSNCLKDLTGTETIGRRTLPSFFQTNIVSAKTVSILSVGGFEPLIQGWGLEDTFLGALLVANGCHLIPCPSAVAFNLEASNTHDQAKHVDLELNRLKYEELVAKTRMAEYSKDKFQERVAFLSGKVDVVK